MGPPIVAAAALSGGALCALDHSKSSGSLTSPAWTGLFSMYLRMRENSSVDRTT